MNTNSIHRTVARISCWNTQAWDSPDGYEAVCETKQIKHLKQSTKDSTEQDSDEVLC